jgi:hypothetical protein
VAAQLSLSGQTILVFFKYEETAKKIQRVYGRQSEVSKSFTRFRLDMVYYRRSEFGSQEIRTWIACSYILGFRCSYILGFRKERYGRIVQHRFHLHILHARTALLEQFAVALQERIELRLQCT